MWIYRLEKTTLSTQEGGPAKRDKTPDPSTGDGGPDKRPQPCTGEEGGPDKRDITQAPEREGQTSETWPQHGGCRLGQKVYFPAHGKEGNT